MDCLTDLVEVDNRLPELVLELVKVSHTNLTEVTGMVLVQVGTVVVLTTGHTTTTGMLASLADTTVTGGDVTAAGRRMSAGARERGGCAGVYALLAGLGESGRHFGGCVRLSLGESS